MTEKFQNKYRIASSRLKNWDYGWHAAYFVTICTQNREYYFGDVLNGKMQLSEIGKIVDAEWLKTFEMRPDMNLKMGAYIIMPNHFHAIIIIGDNQYNAQFVAQCRDAMHCVSTDSDINTTNKFGPQSKNLSSIIRGFKIGVCKNARIIHADFSWQSRFHDHIIRTDESYNRIEEYILANPQNWVNDEFNIY